MKNNPLPCYAWRTRPKDILPCPLCTWESCPIIPAGSAFWVCDGTHQKPNVGAVETIILIMSSLNCNFWGISGISHCGPLLQSFPDLHEIEKEAEDFTINPRNSRLQDFQSESMWLNIPESLVLMVKFPFPLLNLNKP